MGLFDKLTGKSDITLTPPAGLLLASILMVAIDGNVDDNELAAVRRLDFSSDGKAWELAVRAWKTRNVEENVTAVAACLNMEQRTVCIANLIDIAMADGYLAGQEKELLEFFVQQFGIEERRITPIVNVIALKNNVGAFKA